MGAALRVLFHPVLMCGNSCAVLLHSNRTVTLTEDLLLARAYTRAFDSTTPPCYYELPPASVISLMLPYGRWCSQQSGSKKEVLLLHGRTTWFSGPELSLIDWLSVPSRLVWFGVLSRLD